jgi:hypothetical protein
MGCVAPPDAIEGGGLAIDYCRPGNEITRRIVFAFNELGMWVVHPRA